MSKKKLDLWTEYIPLMAEKLKVFERLTGTTMKTRLVKIEAHPINENEQIAFIQGDKVCFDLSAVENSKFTREEFTKCVNVFVAAPELLEALEDLTALAIQYASELENSKTVAKSIAIIKKAKS